MKYHDISAIQFHLYFWQTPFNDSQAVLTNTVVRHPIMKHRVNPAHLMIPLENFQTPISLVIGSKAMRTVAISGNTFPIPYQ